MGHHDALHQWHSADPQGFLGRYQLVSTYQPQYGRVVVTVVSELPLDLECNLPHLEMEVEVVEYYCGTGVILTRGSLILESPLPPLSAHIHTHTVFLVFFPKPLRGGSGNETNPLSCMCLCEKVGLSRTEFTQIHLSQVGTWGRVTFTLF